MKSAKAQGRPNINRSMVNGRRLIVHTASRTRQEIPETWMRNMELNKIYQGDCLEIMNQWPDRCVDLIITSPPYNLKKQYSGYNDDLKHSDYLKWLGRVLRESSRVLKDSGRMCLNVPFDIDNREGERYPLYGNIIQMNPLKYRSTIYWDSGNIPVRTAWGSFCSASAPHINLPGEAIVIFYKNRWKRDPGHSDIEKAQFIKWSNGKWKMQPEMDRTHAAPFPIELPQRCIKMFSYKTDIILDPFLGSGTTALAAEQLGRKWVGIEISTEDCKFAQTRIDNERAQIKMF